MSAPLRENRPPVPLKHHAETAYLIFLGVVIFVMLALAALVIDLGFAIVARREMQTVVNTAALSSKRDSGMCAS